MPVTKQDIEEFGRFAKKRLDNDDVESLVDLVRLWEAERREYEETVADVRAGIADYDAGHGKEAKEAFAEIRKQMGLDE